MGQKVHPIGFRLGIYRDALSRWYARKTDYGNFLIEDLKIIRPFIEQKLGKIDISKIEIERAADTIRVIVHSGKPGLIIGRKGEGINSLRLELAKKLGRQTVDISVQEVRQPALDAMLIARNIADQLEKRASYKRLTKRAAMVAMKEGALGINICVAGRIGGAEIARSHWTRTGSVPRQTLRSDVDYALAEALTTYGILGIKVWLCRGEFQDLKQMKNAQGRE